MTRITGAEVEKMFTKTEWACRLAAQLDADAANAGDAAEWRAFAVVRDHRMKLSGEGVVMFQDGTVRTIRVGGAVIDAPTPTALLAKLDALAEAAKPQEVWRWREANAGNTSFQTFPSALACRQYPWLDPGHPVREVTRPDGVIELHPEAK